MASGDLGSQMDMHSDGIDLAFPHHDRSMLLRGWHPSELVNYFLHMVHLSIAGSKMSKSLKNFQTVKDALKTDYCPS